MSVNVQNPFSLIGQTIAITGASSGIGRQVAVACAAMGATVVALGRNEERLAETLGLLAGDGHRSVSVDLNDYERVNQILPDLPPINGLVNSMGIPMLIPVRQMARETLQRVVDTNFVATANLVHLLLKTNRVQNGASIIFMSSIVARAGCRGQAPYSAAKAATTAFMRALSQEVAKKQIRVNAISPASVETPIWGSGWVLDKISEQYPLGIGQPQDVANLAVFLLSSASRWITGTDILLEGGLIHHV